MDKKTLQSILDKEKSDSNYREFLRQNNHLANGKKIESGQFTDDEFFAQIKETFVIIEK